MPKGKKLEGSPAPVKRTRTGRVVKKPIKVDEFLSPRKQRLFDSNMEDKTGKKNLNMKLKVKYESKTNQVDKLSRSVQRSHGKVVKKLDRRVNGDSNNSAQLVNVNMMKPKTKQNENNESKKIMFQSFGCKLNVTVENGLKVNEQVTTPMNRVVDDNGTGDEIMISVHVPEDEFPSDEEDFVTTDDVEVRQVVMHQAPGGVSVGGRPLRAPNIQHDEADYAARRADVQRMKEDPLFKEMVGQAVVEQIRIKKEKEKDKTGGNDKQVMEIEQPISNVIGGVAQIKSPSDTMIYAPALNRSPTVIGKLNNTTSVGVAHVANQGACNTVMSNDIRLLNQVSDQGEAINKITEFLESMRLNVAQGGDSSDDPRLGGLRQVVADEVNAGPGMQDGLIDHHDENGETQGCSIAKQMVIDAEKYKATIDHIEGKQVTYPINHPPQTIDDEFFPFNMPC